jgi:hypothetical protein
VRPPLQGDVESQALVQLVVSVRYPFEGVLQLGKRNRRHEAEPADVATQNGDPCGTGQASAPKQRPVAAERKQAIELRPHRLERTGLQHALRRVGQLFV